MSKPKPPELHKWKELVELRDKEGNAPWQRAHLTIDPQYENGYGTKLTWYLTDDVKYNVRDGYYDPKIGYFKTLEGAMKRGDTYLKRRRIDQ